MYPMYSYLSDCDTVGGDSLFSPRMFDNSGLASTSKRTTSRRNQLIPIRCSCVHSKKASKTVTKVNVSICLYEGHS